jgi:hypothetical protein
MPPDQKWTPRRLNITGCKEVYRGNGAKGEFVIYELEAVNEQGAVVNQPLSSFSMLPLGLADYEVAPYHKDGQLKNYTVRKPGGNSGNSAKVDALASRVQYLEEQVSWLTDQVNGHRALLEQLSKERAPNGATPASVSAGASPPDDDDIPF